MGVTPDRTVKMDDGRAQYSSVCSFCAHSDGELSGYCKAFPKGIPDEIWEGKNKHTDPVEGDHGILFEPA